MLEIKRVLTRRKLQEIFGSAFEIAKFYDTSVTAVHSRVVSTDNVVLISTDHVMLIVTALAKYSQPFPNHFLSILIGFIYK